MKIRPAEAESFPADGHTWWRQQSLSSNSRARLKAVSSPLSRTSQNNQPAVATAATVWLTQSHRTPAYMYVRIIHDLSSANVFVISLSINRHEPSSELISSAVPAVCTSVSSHYIQYNTRSVSLPSAWGTKICNRTKKQQNAGSPVSRYERTWKGPVRCAIL